MMKIANNTRFKKIHAKHDSLASCGHNILSGDIIGYDPHTEKTRCAVCFANIRAREGKKDQESMNRNMRLE